MLASLTVVLLFFVVLLFPDGRLPSRRWRPVLWAGWVVAAGALAQQLQVGIVTGGLTNALAVARVTYPNRWDICLRVAGSAWCWREASSCR